MRKLRNQPRVSYRDEKEGIRKLSEYINKMANNLTEVVSVENYGAKGDGIADDTLALQDAFDSSDNIIIPKGTYLCSSQLIYTAPSAQRANIYAYEAIITTSGAISGIEVNGGSPNGGLSIHGLTINHRGNSNATAGYDIVGAWNARLYDCTVEAHGVSASYAAFRVQNTDPADKDTGSFWTKIINPWVRKRSGTDVGNITVGIELLGAANATRITGGGLGNCTTGVHISIDTGETVVPSSIIIDDVDITGFTTGIHVEGAAASTLAGHRFILNRFETGTTAFSFTGTTSQPARPPLLFGNDIASSVTNYLNNPNNLVINSLDMSTTPAYGAAAMSWAQDTTIKASSGSTHPLTVKTLGGNRGIRLEDGAGNAIIQMLWDGSGTGSQILGSASGDLRIRGIGGISGTTAHAENLRGKVTFATSGTAAVSFGTNEPNAIYFITLGGDTSETFWITAKATTGFTINSSNASSTAVVDWVLIR